MDFAELRYVCQEAAMEVLASKGRPVPTTVVLPGGPKTQLVTLPDFPDDDESRHALLAGVVEDHLKPREAPAWGFVAEAETADGVDLLLVVYGARRHPPHLTVATFTEDGTALEAFVEGDEELDKTAMPFLHPLQHAVDALPGLEDPNAPLTPPPMTPPGATGLPLA